jgi:NAD(P)-dependent dehydrogenase (short-subunit alcohol dehydrogenase family)
LRRELLPFGIDVVVIAPGAVATPIGSKAEQVDISPYLDTPHATALEGMRAFMLTLGKSGPPPEQIGEAVLRALTAAKPKVRLGTSAPSTRLRKTEIQPNECRRMSRLCPLSRKTTFAHFEVYRF